MADSTAATAVVAPAAHTQSRFRWVVIALIFLVTLINIVDRLTISVLAPVITVSLHLSNFQFAGISTWFLVAYAVSQLLSGRLYDRIGNRRGFSISVSLWSAAAMLHAAAQSLAGLSVLRFVLGLGAAGNWPGAAKVIGEWFSAKESAFAMAIFNSGAAIGSVAAPALIVGLQLRFGWQATFVVTGLLGFLWLVLWLAFYRTPADYCRRAGLPAPIKRERTGPRKGMAALLRDRKAWAILVGRFFTDPVWWLYITWLPLYLSQVHGFDLKQIAAFAWVPYLGADAGSLAGGWASGFLMRLGWTWGAARRSIIVVSALLMASGFFITKTESSGQALAVISVVLFGFQAWINNVQVLPADFYDDDHVATVAGLGGLGAGCGAILFVLATGWVVDHWSYRPILIAASLLPLIGTALLLLLTDNFNHAHLRRVES